MCFIFTFLSFSLELNLAFKFYFGNTLSLISVMEVLGLEVVEVEMVRIMKLGGP